MYNLLKYSSIGCYPQMLCRDYKAYCVDCANKLEPKEGDVVDANWENPELYCDECEERIESAYAEAP
jgi:hypothetical protein